MATESREFTIYICPKCGEEVPDHYGPPMLPERGHYHDDPENRFRKRIFHAAEQITVVPKEQAEARLREVEFEQGELRDALEAAGCLARRERERKEQAEQQLRERLLSDEVLAAASAAVVRVAHGRRGDASCANAARAAVEAALAALPSAEPATHHTAGEQGGAE